MPRYTCTCGARYRLPESSKGKRARCKKCGQVFTIPHAAVPGAPAADQDHGYAIAPSDEPPPPRRVPGSGGPGGSDGGSTIRTLNDPVPMDDKDNGDWSPTSGIARAVWRGGLTALLLAALSGPIVYYLPYMLFHFWLRAGLGFIITLIMFGVVQSAAGMVGSRCSALAVALSLLVLASHHAVLAVHGLPTTSGTVADWGHWFHPVTLFLHNASALGGIGVGAALCHSAGVSLSTLTDLLKT